MPNIPPAGVPDKAASVTRIEALSDGVFAVALTLLVLDIKVPDVPAGASLMPALPDLIERFLVYGLSFLVVGYAWIWHHLIFGLLEKSTRGLLWLNLLGLLPVAFLPFSAAFIAKYPQSNVAVATYGLSITAFSIILNLMWCYAKREGLVAEEAGDATHKATTARVRAFAVLSLASTVVAVLWPQVGLFLFALVPLGYVLTGGRHSTG